MSESPGAPSGPVAAVGADDGVRIDGLRVDHTGRRLRIPPRILAAPAAQPVVELPDQHAVAPAAEEYVDPVPRWEPAGIARHLTPLSTRYRIASSIARWQYASGCLPRPRIEPGTGSSGRTTVHSASVMSEGCRRTRSG